MLKHPIPWTENHHIQYHGPNTVTSNTMDPMLSWDNPPMFLCIGLQVPFKPPVNYMERI